MLPMPDRLPPRIMWTLLLAWGVFTLATLGAAPLFDYDETIYAQTAIDMMRHGEWIVPTANGMQFFEKPPFTYYMMDLCFSIFGENAFSARLPSAVFSFGTALLLLHFGARLHSRRMGFAAAGIFLSMLEVGFLAHAAILDAVLNFFIAACLLNFALWLTGGQRRHALWCAAMMGAAVSIKGPVGAVVPLLIIFAERLLSGNLLKLLRDIPWLQAIPIFLLTATPWYVMILAINGPAFLYDFIVVHNIERALHPMQGHGGRWHYYILVFAVSVLPWLATLPWVFGRGWRMRRESDNTALLARLGILWTLIVIVLFSFAQTKLPHYISCIYPGVAMLIAAVWMHGSPEPARVRNMIRASMLVLLPAALLLLAFPMIYPWLEGFTHHPRALAILSQGVAPSWSISLYGALLLGVLVWLVGKASRTRLLIALMLTGMVMQFSLLTGLGTFAARLMQAPTMRIAEVVKSLPGDMPFHSYNLNAPSASFYAGRNYKIHLGPAGGEELRSATRPLALMMRSESLPELPWLAGVQPQIDQGGFLLFVLRDKPAPATIPAP